MVLGPGGKKSLNVAVIVAHPDDETIWAGGTILLYSDWRCTVISLCRGDDVDRAPKYIKATRELNAMARIGHLDDSPDQPPLDVGEVQRVLLSLLPSRTYDVILTHSPYGEYTRHLRHEETGRAVISLWQGGKLSTEKLWLFAYEDGGSNYSPRPIETAHRTIKLPQPVLKKKFDIIIGTYGFTLDSFEAKAITEEEAFWCFTSPDEYNNWKFSADERIN